MKQVYSVLVLLLVLAVALPTPVWADGWTDRPDLPDNGGAGGGIEDSDHPWGGDYIIGGGSEDGSKSCKTTVLTGYIVIDAVVSFIYNGTLFTEADLLKTRQPAVLSKPSRPVTVKSNGKYLISARKER